MPSQGYVGLGHTADNPPDDLTILEIDDSTIKFELGIYRIAVAEGMAKIESDKIVFVADVHFSGTLKFNGNSILVTVDKSEHPYIKARTTYNFTIKVEKNQPLRKVKHYYADDGQTYGRFFDDGTCEVDDNILSDETNATYKEYPTYLLTTVGQKKWQFFNDGGYILIGWNIINHYKVYSYLQITNFENETAQIPAKDIHAITETCLIFITPEDGYEEWMWYQDDRKKEYAEKGIQSIDAEKRYLSFMLYDGEKITVDTKQKQNGTIPPSTLLYKKGYIPIMISISGESEEGMEQIKWYLEESGDGDLPFERWNTLKEYN
jgi:hypothetical protein